MIEEDDEEKEFKLSLEQMENTYWHEVTHVFQFYFNNEFDEKEAQVFGNFLAQMFSDNIVASEKELLED